MTRPKVTTPDRWSVKIGGRTVGGAALVLGQSRNPHTGRFEFQENVAYFQDAALAEVVAAMLNKDDDKRGVNRQRYDSFAGAVGSTNPDISEQEESR